MNKISTMPATWTHRVIIGDDLRDEELQSIVEATKGTRFEALVQYFVANGNTFVTNQELLQIASLQHGTSKADALNRLFRDKKMIYAFLKDPNQGRCVFPQERMRFWPIKYQ